MNTVNTSSIPPEELRKFDENLRGYKQGGEILTEGHPDDNAIYLLRTGTVGVFRRGTGGSQMMIATIDAVNVFGEMALVSGGPRTATIRVISEDAVVYKFIHPDIKALIANPTWSELLITRLVSNLKRTSDQLVQAEIDRNRYQRQEAAAADQTAILLSAFSQLVERVADDVVVNSREWHFLKGLNRMTSSYLRAHLPEIYTKMQIDPEGDFQRMLKEPGLPDLLREVILRKLSQIDK